MLDRVYNILHIDGDCLDLDNCTYKFCMITRVIKNYKGFLRQLLAYFFQISSKTFGICKNCKQSADNVKKELPSCENNFRDTY